jgi:hypothetical protein
MPDPLLAIPQTGRSANNKGPLLSAEMKDFFQYQTELAIFP